MKIPLFLVVPTVLILACAPSEIVVDLAGTSSPTLPPASSPTANGAIYRWTVGNLNLRDLPDETDPGSHVLAVIPAGDGVRWLGICSMDRAWTRVRWHDLEGWVAVRWLSPEVCR